MSFGKKNFLRRRKLISFRCRFDLLPMLRCFWQMWRGGGVLSAFISSHIIWKLCKNVSEVKRDWNCQSSHRLTDVLSVHIWLVWGKSEASSSAGSVTEHLWMTALLYHHDPCVWWSMASHCCSRLPSNFDGMD